MNDKFKHDKLKFELIRNADLVCTDCLYKYDDTNMPCNVSKCEMYEEKPSTVIDGGNCEDVYKRQAYDTFYKEQGFVIVSDENENIEWEEEENG